MKAFKSSKGLFCDPQILGGMCNCVYNLSQYVTWGRSYTCQSYPKKVDYGLSLQWRVMFWFVPLVKPTDSRWHVREVLNGELICSSVDW
jgi:hypothetical protein